MIIGIPKEIKPCENRVGLTPGGVVALRTAGHTVLVEHDAGVGSALLDEEYVHAGAEIVDSAAAVYGQAEMIVKVKEPLKPEYNLIREGQILFTYLHLAPEPELTQALLVKKASGVAYETVRLPDGSLPLLIPMSEVAGRMSVQIGAQLLERHHGGKGILLGGVPGVEPANVVIVGGGIVGTNAAKIAMGMGAWVTILDKSSERMRYLDDIFNGRVTTVMSDVYSLTKAVRQADLLIGAVLLPGARAPRLVTEAMVKNMSPGSVIVDVAIDQGGCVETIDHVTTHENPTYVKHGVVHYAVANIPGAVARTSTFALTSATLPYALTLANKGFREAVMTNPALFAGVNVYKGHLTYQAVAAALDLPYTPLTELL